VRCRADNEFLLLPGVIHRQYDWGKEELACHFIERG
jgi:hypothetical protein